MTRNLPAQLWRFFAIGAANSAVTLLTFAALLSAGLHYLPAGAAAFALGALTGFALNRTWTFAHTGSVGFTGLRYLAVQVAGLAANIALLHAGVSLGLGRLAAQVGAIGPVTLLTFVLNRGWTFRSRGTSALDATSPASHSVVVDRDGPRRRHPVRARRLTGGGRRSGDSRG